MIRNNTSDELNRNIENAMPAIADLVGKLTEQGEICSFDTGNDISDAAIIEIINACRKAPTSGNNQLYSFVWLRDQMKIDSVKALFEDCSYPAEGRHHLIIGTIDLHRMERLLDYRCREFQMAPIMALFQGAIDVALAARAMSILAMARGYGVCWLEGVIKYSADISRLINANPKVLPIIGLGIGFPSGEITDGYRPGDDRQLIIHKEAYSEAYRKSGISPLESFIGGTDEDVLNSTIGIESCDEFLAGLERNLLRTVFQQEFFED